MSDSNRLKISWATESTFGVTPPSSTFYEVRQTGESLTMETNTTTSQEIRADRETVAVVRTGINAAGDINWELAKDSAGTHFDKLLEYALLSAAWTSATNIITTGTSIAPDGTLQQFQGGVGDFSGVGVGEWLLVAGFNNTANNGYFKVVDKAADSSTIDVVGETDLVTTAAETDITMDIPPYIEAGTTFTTLTFEKDYQDVSEKMYIRGCAIDTMNVSIGSDSISTGSFGIIGKDANFTAPTTPSYSAASTEQPMNGIDHVTTIVLGIGAPGTGSKRGNATQITLDLANNLRARLQIGTLGAISLGTGQIGITGTLQSYFTDRTEMESYLNYADSGFGFITNDTVNGLYIFDLPAMKFTAGAAVAQGINTDIINDMSFTGYLSPTAGASFRIYRG